MRKLIKYLPTQEKNIGMEAVNKTPRPNIPSNRCFVKRTRRWFIKFSFNHRGTCNIKESVALFLLKINIFLSKFDKYGVKEENFDETISQKDTKRIYWGDKVEPSKHR